MKLKRRNNTLESLVTPQDYIMALSFYRNKKVFFNQINMMIDQFNRFIKRQNTLITILYQNFNNDEDLTDVIQNTNDLERKLYSNVRSSLECMSAFNAEKYEIIKDKKDRTGKEEERYQHMRQQIQSVENSQKKNEEILLEINRLLTQISRMITSEEPNDLSKLKACIN